MSRFVVRVLDPKAAAQKAAYSNLSGPATLLGVGSVTPTPALIYDLEWNLTPHWDCIDAAFRGGTQAHPLDIRERDIVQIFLEPLIPAIAALVPPVAAVVQLMAAQLKPVLQIISWVLQNIVAPVFVFVARLIAGIWNAIATAINNLLGWAGVHVDTIDLPEGGSPGGGGGGAVEAVGAGRAPGMAGLESARSPAPPATCSLICSRPWPPCPRKSAS
ncbi:hypothetical protein [Calidithermus timidus]|jgi:hypothetical protein|uniref:hypothetical protein n=1 Tax=Calidithermus timidus TaxID=307124 RepID=UPI000362A42C|nr:hypothetical protein [Calidithermus timidus]